MNICNQIKQLNLRLKSNENTIVRDYVLPDYANIRKGYAKSQEESTGKAINSEQVLQLFIKKKYFLIFFTLNHLDNQIKQ